MIPLIHPFDASLPVREESDVRIMCIGDIHITEDNIQSTLLLTEHLISIAQREKPDLIFVMGDTLDRRNFTSIPVKTANDCLRKFKQVSPVVLLIGNHDLPNTSAFLSSYHAFDATKEWSDFTVVDDCCRIVTCKGLKFAAIPYVPPGRMWEAFSSNPEFDLSHMTAVFGHQEIRGGQHRGHVSHKGDVYPIDGPLLILGHFHEHHWVQPNAVYVGTPRQVKRDESPKKTISIFDFKPDGKFVEHRVDTAMPPYLEFKISTQDIDSFEPPLSGEIKISITDTYANNRLYTNHPKVKDWKHRHFVVVFNDIEPLPVGCSNANFFQEIDQSRSFHDILARKFAENPRQSELFQQIFSKKIP